MGTVPFDSFHYLPQLEQGRITELTRSIWMDRPRHVGDVEIPPQLWPHPPEPPEEPQLVKKKRRRRKRDRD